jgi:hypothetical protein
MERGQQLTDLQPFFPLSVLQRALQSDYFVSPWINCIHIVSKKPQPLSAA